MYEGQFENFRFHGSGTYRFSPTGPYAQIGSVGLQWHEGSGIFRGKVPVLKNFGMSLPPLDPDGSVPAIKSVERERAAAELIISGGGLEALLARATFVTLFPTVVVGSLGLTAMAVTVYSEGEEHKAAIALENEIQKHKGVIYLREDPEAAEINPQEFRGTEGITTPTYSPLPPTIGGKPVLFQYVGKTTAKRYECRRREHIKAKRKLYGLEKYVLTKQQQGIPIPQPPAMEQLYMEQYGGLPGKLNLQNKINAMGLSRWNEWIRQGNNLARWNQWRAECFLP